MSHQTQHGQIPHQTGFTLIEVMVALAILAVVAVAASRASSAYLRSVDTLRTRTLAHFVAQNTAAQLRLEKTWFVTPQTEQVNAQGRDWQVVMTPETTQIASLRQVTISVAPVVDGKALNSVTDLSVMISDPTQTGTIDLSGFR